MYQEHVFFENELLKISSTRISFENKTIAMKSVCSVELDTEKVQFPTYIFGIGFLIALSSSIATPAAAQALLYIGLFIALFSLALFGIMHSRREKSIIIKLDSGDTEVFSKEDLDEANLEEVYKSISDAIIFRG